MTIVPYIHFVKQTHTVVEADLNGAHYIAVAGLRLLAILFSCLGLLSAGITDVSQCHILVFCLFVCLVGWLVGFKFFF